MKIPRTMSTQHPDNARMPFFAGDENVINLKAEIEETYWIFDLGCHEQMWDYEGKESDPLVVSKLLSLAQEFFKQNPLGRERFLTLRVPNPEIERTETKLLLEILESIPRFSDTASSFYGEESIPVFEVILSMTTSARSLNRLYYYYQNFVFGKGKLPLFDNDLTVKQWVGEFKPENINVIPLFEDKDSILGAAKIMEEYLKNKNLEYQRVFLARSDPALNYGSLATVLLLNVSLQRLKALEKKIGIPIYPILGVGSAPFRGNLKPSNVESILRGYPSCQTFTIQSAFKYDWPKAEVTQAIQKINSTPPGEPLLVDEKKSIALAEKISQAYQAQIPEIATLVNRLAVFVPRRRLRKLHIGLFGYSRNLGEIRLPRAIPFCATLYSVGLPPEILGLQCLDSEEIKLVKEFYPSPNFEEDLRDALTYFNPRVFSLLSPKLREEIERVLKIVDFEVDKEHQEITNQVIDCLLENRTEGISELILKAALLRKFLG